MPVGPLKGHCADLEGNEAHGNGGSQEFSFPERHMIDSCMWMYHTQDLEFDTRLF